MPKVHKIDRNWYMDNKDALGRRKRIRTKIQKKKWAE